MSIVTIEQLIAAKPKYRRIYDDAFARGTTYDGITWDANPDYKDYGDPTYPLLHSEAAARQFEAQHLAEAWGDGQDSRSFRTYGIDGQTLDDELRVYRNVVAGQVSGAGFWRGYADSLKANPRVIPTDLISIIGWEHISKGGYSTTHYEPHTSAFPKIEAARQAGLQAKIIDYGDWRAAHRADTARREADEANLA